MTGRNKKARKSRVTKRSRPLETPGRAITERVKEIDPTLNPYYVWPVSPPGASPLDPGYLKGSPLDANYHRGSLLDEYVDNDGQGDPYGNDFDDVFRNEF